VANSLLKHDWQPERTNVDGIGLKPDPACQGIQLMDPRFRFGAPGQSGLQVVWEDDERVLCRGWLDIDGERRAVLAALSAAEHPAPSDLDRFAHEFALKDELDGAWAVRPLALRCDHGRPTLVLEDPGGEPLEALLGRPMPLGLGLRVALGLAEAVAGLHQRGLIHRDIKPAHILVDPATGAVRLTGFGLASRLPRERTAPDPPELISGTLAYMAPEQTGRMNRSVDARSDLYTMGVTLYRMFTRNLPFSASEPMEWVHCQIARRPVPPAERAPGVPAALSAVVMKLLAKTAEERYQTAAGLAADLRSCLTDWERDGRIAPFAPGEHDVPDRLRIPEKLYGRGDEVGRLLAAFERVVDEGAPELVLVSGYSGIGKSALVNELHKALVPPRGLFAAGKFDQSRRDVPYATLAQAVQSLIRQILGESDAAIGRWRAALVDALGPNAHLMVDLVPQLKLVIGEQPPVPKLPPQDAQRRFQLVVRRLLGVFARAEHPLVLFLDDLQWLDPATLDLLEDLLTQPELGHLLLIGAYRDNEVDAAHPLKRTLAAIRQAGTHVQDITLAPLARDHLGQMITDALRCEPAHAAPLADLVHAKTAGNPFFVIQFLSALAEEDLLRFDHGAARWGWDLAGIHAKGYTDNVVDLMVGKLTRLPVATRIALQQLACLGNTAAVPMLAIVLGTVEAQVHADLWEAARQELVLLLGGTCRFVHDRVQEAAYSLIPEASRAAAHLRIGRLLVAHTKPKQQEEAIFEILSQLNRGAALITEPAEREQLAELNLIAGQRAKASAAYTSALAYLTTGAALLAEDCWERRHELLFALELNLAECEFLTGALLEAEQHLAALSARAATTIEQANVACLRIDLYVTLAQSGRAITVGLDYLRHLGIEWPPHPTKDEARGEYERIWSQLGGRPIEELVDLPLMTDSASLATLDVLIKLLPPALFTDMNLFALVPCRAINLSLLRGNCDASCVAYVQLGLVAGAHFGDYQAGYRFGRLGCELVDQRGLRRFQARTYMLFGGHLVVWAEHVRAGRDLLRRAFDAANQIGDVTFAAYSGTAIITNLLVVGEPLIEVQREAEHGLAYAQKARFGLSVDLISAQLGLVRTLRGLTPEFGSLDGKEFDELGMERHFHSNSDLAFAECLYWTRKLQARFVARNYAAAVEASLRAQSLLWTSLTLLERADYHFYGALSLAAFHDSALPDQRAPHREALAAHHRQLEVWAANCPENFENRAALVGAEIARIEGRELDAERLYEQAIRSARANDFVHNEALANELAGCFYAARGFEKIAHVYLRDARHGYLRWGADGKVRQLDELYPRLRGEERVPGPADTIGAPVEQLDLATVLKVSQAVSGEIVIDKLLDALMRMAIEHAGAQRGLLIAPRGTEQRIAAEATTHGDTVVVRLHDAPLAAAALPESTIHYVLRTRELVIVNDAAAENPLPVDTYLRQQQVRSILCLPLINQGKLIGVLYLENNLTPGAFAPARITVLKLLASQAAIALENTRLYRDLAEREARIRRLVDANIIGMLISRRAGDILEANDAFLKLVGYDREDLVAGHLRWTELTPPEWHDRTAQALAELQSTGSIQPFEKEYFRKDGGRVPVLVGVAAFDEEREHLVAFVLDLTERKRGEAEAREGERRYREVQSELAHANRVATMGQLTASIAHEVNQPIAATVANAQAGLNWLSRQPPDLEEARQAFDRIVKNGNRAGGVILGIRALIKKVPPQTDRLKINGAVREVIELTCGEAVKNGVTVRTDLAEGLPLIHGDRVQLQQVILNLIINAIQAMSGVSERERELQISTRTAQAGGVLVAVRDSGPGLDPAQVERLFEAFYTTKPGGIGMGLAICRSIVEAHGGRVWAGTNEPRGAVFQVTVPVERDDTVPPRTPHSSPGVTSPASREHPSGSLRESATGGTMESHR
jgi:PAS domain S-box-containing protein